MELFQEVLEKILVNIIRWKPDSVARHEEKVSSVE